MGRLKTFANSGSLLPADCNNIEDDYEFAFSTYKTIETFSGFLGAANVSGSPGAGISVALVPGGAAPVPASTGDCPINGGIYLDPADYNVGSPNARTTKLRLRVTLKTNAVAPTKTLKAFLSLESGAGFGVSAAHGAWQTGGGYLVNNQTVATTPAASSVTTTALADVTLVTAGVYFIFIQTSDGNSIAANSVVDIVAQLQVRQV